MPNQPSPQTSMDHPPPIPLRIGDWRVDARAGQISRAGESKRLDARSMRLLLCLAERAGTVVSIDELLDHVWSGVIVTPDSVYQAITSLRRLLDDDPKQPAYIATVPRLGYRLVAEVGPWSDQPTASAADAQPKRTNRSTIALRVIIALVLVVAAASLIYSKRSALTGDAATVASRPSVSIAVLPFLDLTTQAMEEEYVADGMTEELIGDLSKIPGYQVPGPTSSFYFKNKTLPVAEIAKQLGVTYVLDGSIRKSGDTVRVSARLIRADDGYVVWTQTYDRLQGDILKIQKDVAADMSNSIRSAVDNTRAAAASR